MNKKIMMIALGMLLITATMVMAIDNYSTRADKLNQAMVNFVEEQTDRNAMDLIIAVTNVQSENQALRNQVARLEVKLENSRCTGGCNPCQATICEECPTYPLGDVNHDGRVNILDLIIIRNEINEIKE